MFEMNDRVIFIAGQYAGYIGKINTMPVSSKSAGYGVLLDNGRGLAAIAAEIIKPVASAEIIRTAEPEEVLDGNRW